MREARADVRRTQYKPVVSAGQWAVTRTVQGNPCAHAGVRVNDDPPPPPSPPLKYQSVHKSSLSPAEAKNASAVGAHASSSKPWGNTCPVCVRPTSPRLMAGCPVWQVGGSMSRFWGQAYTELSKPPRPASEPRRPSAVACAQGMGRAGAPPGAGHRPRGSGPRPLRLLPSAATDHEPGS